MTGFPSSGGPVWDRASLPSDVAVRRASRSAAAAAGVAALAAFAGGWPWAASTAIGAGVVLLVLWGSARVLIGGARRWSPPVALLLAVGLYLIAVVGLLVLAVAARPASGTGGFLRPGGVGLGILVVVLTWTVALLVVHVRHDRGPRRRPRGSRGV